ncbi:MAG: hypothetical protein KDA29_03660 [Phycisphaerales bacterium]|nr:hypothetical protein [Phycisphaerales bacterium]
MIRTPLIGLFFALILLCATPHAMGAPADDPQIVRSAQAQRRAESKLQKIERAVELTRRDPKLTFFVVCLPDDVKQAKAIHSMWTKDNDLIDQHKPSVYFVQGDDARTVLEKASTTMLPTVLSFRHGRPYHCRTGDMDREMLNAYLELALDPELTPTLNGDQYDVIYFSIIELINQGRLGQAANSTAESLLNYEVLRNVKKFSSSFPEVDKLQMSSQYSLYLLYSTVLTKRDPKLIPIFDQTRELAKHAWEQNRDENIGIALWIDLSWTREQREEVLEWATAGKDDPRTINAMQDSFPRLSSLFIENQRWELLGRSIRSSEDMKWNMRSAISVSKELRRDGDKAKASQVIEDCAREVSLCHAALLLAGRDQEAWEVVENMRQILPSRLIEPSLCAAALEVGVVTPRHKAMFAKLNPESNAELMRAFAQAQGDD